MQVSLTPKLEELVRRKVDSGLYGDESEVVREALPMMLEDDEVHRLKVETLQRALDEGECSAPAEPLDMDGLLAELDSEVARES